MNRWGDELRDKIAEARRGGGDATRLLTVEVGAMIGPDGVRRIIAALGLTNARECWGAAAGTLTLSDADARRVKGSAGAMLLISYTFAYRSTPVAGRPPAAIDFAEALPCAAEAASWRDRPPML